VFPTDPDYTETFGHHLETGAVLTEDEYRAKEPAGRAFLHAVDYEPAPEVPDDEYPLALTTGRTISQFHTRSKTGRAPELNDAAPDPWVEIHASDAAAVGIAEGDRVRIESRRGHVVVPARLGGIRRGAVFMPFHYGYWDVADGAGPGRQPPRAANELTLTRWDPVSKQPLFKEAAVRISKET
jgi:anaerobic selenocysteine-containing dehydrogenase